MNLHLTTAQWVIGAVVVTAWTCVAVWATRWVGPAITEPPTPEFRPVGSGNHPSGRLMGCPDAVTVSADGRLQEVWL